MDEILQESAASPDSRGRLNPEQFRRNITFRTLVPPDDLAPFIEHFWIIRWDRAGAEPYISEQLLHRPYTDLFITNDDAGLQITFRGKREYRAEGKARITGARFKPGGLHAFWGASPHRWVDATVSLQEPFPNLSDALPQIRQASDERAVLMLAEYLRSRRPVVDPKIATVNAIIARVEQGDLRTVAEVASALDRSERWVQDLFQEYVGVGLKWFLQRQRLLGVAERIRAEVNPDWPAMAYDLGYSSQQHFITDFERVVGKTPSEYKDEVESQR